MLRAYCNPSGRCILVIWNSMDHLNTHSDTVRYRTTQKYNFLSDYRSVSKKTLEKRLELPQLTTSQRSHVAQKYMRISMRNYRGCQYVIDSLAILQSIAQFRAKTSCPRERSTLVRSPNAVQRINRRHADLVCDLQEIPKGADKISHGDQSIERLSQC